MNSEQKWGVSPHFAQKDGIWKASSEGSVGKAHQENLLS
jgi:hypothetical protein